LIVAAIPACNEEKTIAKAAGMAMRHVDKVVVVDDGSSDDTVMIAERLGADIVRHEGNLGYGAAIRCCLTAARDLNSDILVMLTASTARTIYRGFWLPSGLEKPTLYHWLAFLRSKRFRDSFIPSSWAETCQ
jgi:glycosyltransferase involved in cell wall biosynthesis